jgi:hypothetical protein
MLDSHIVVLVFDRLGAGWLGPYGATWINTPGFNELAAESLLCEFMLSDSVDLPTVYRSYWQGVAAHCTATAAPSPSLPELAKAAGLEPWLVTDEPQLLQLPTALQFHEQVLLQTPPPHRAAKSIEQMQLADLLTTAMQELVSTPQPKLLWVHASAMQSAWDAPHEYCEQFVGEEDPLPPKLHLPPQHAFLGKPDPDELLGYLHAYAGQVVALDACLGSFRDELARKFDPERITLAVTAPRGYPLGEHGYVGQQGDRLRGELLQVPLLLRLPQRAHQLTRLTGLHQPVDFFATLAGLCGHSVTSGVNLLRVASDELPSAAIALAWSEQEQAIRTPAWFYRQSQGADETERQQELYVKPDDRWEVNEISQRAANVAVECETLLQQLTANRADPQRLQTSLPAILTEPQT